MSVITLATALLSLAASVHAGAQSVTAVQQCAYPLPNGSPAPSPLPACGAYQTFILQAVGGCDFPENGRYLGFDDNDVQYGNIAKIGNNDPPVQYYLNGTAMYPVPETTPNATYYGFNTPLSANYALSSPNETLAIDAPLTFNPVGGPYPCCDVFKAMEVSIVDDYLNVTAPLNQGTYLNFEPEEGQTWLYISPEQDPFIAGCNPGECPVYPVDLLVIPTCQ